MINLQAISQVGLEDHLYRVLEITIPIVLFMWANKRQAKKDVEKRHEENQKLITGLLTERKYYPAHSHGEKEGPLSFDGISYPPRDS